MTASWLSDSTASADWLQNECCKFKQQALWPWAEWAAYASMDRPVGRIDHAILCFIAFKIISSCFHQHKDGWHEIYSCDHVWKFPHNNRDTKKPANTQTHRLKQKNKVGRCIFYFTSYVCVFLHVFCMRLNVSDCRHPTYWLKESKKTIKRGSVCVYGCVYGCACVKVYAPSSCALEKSGTSQTPSSSFLYSPPVYFTLSDNKIASDLCVTIYSRTYALLTYQ